MTDERPDPKLKEIEEARERILDGEIALMDTYFGVIRRVYISSRPIDRRRIIRGIEKLTGTSSAFDREKAKAIRYDLGLTGEKLAEQIGLKPSTLRNIESKGIHGTTFYTAKAVGTRKYLLWLKKYGYNPFNL